MSSAELTVQASGLVTGYHSDSAARRITRTDFTWRAGRIIALVGPNGVGKTTLLRTVIGLLRPLDGEVRIGGLPVAEYRAARGIGYLPEALDLPESWTGLGLLALAAGGGVRPWDRGLDEAVAMAGIDFPLAQPVRSMSKGMRQRLALALALVTGPQLLLLDEPEAGLDPGQRLRLRDRVRRMAADGRLVVVASHDVSGLCSIADEAYLLREEGMSSIATADLQDPDKISQMFAGSSR